MNAPRPDAPRSDVSPLAAGLGLDSDDFQLFDLPRRYELDLAALAQRWKVLQAAAHPDRFVAAGAQAQRLAMQWSVRVNEAYQHLKDPLQRATQLCALHGMPVQAERHTAMPAEFLVQQMQWREALDEAGDDATLLGRLQAEVQQQRQQRLQALQQAIDQRQDWAAAAALVRELMFMRRLADQVAERLDRLQD